MKNLQARMKRIQLEKRLIFLKTSEVRHHTALCLEKIVGHMHA